MSLIHVVWKNPVQTSKTFQRDIRYRGAGELENVGIVAQSVVAGSLYWILTLLASVRAVFAWANQPQQICGSIPFQTSLMLQICVQSPRQLPLTSSAPSSRVYVPAIVPVQPTAAIAGLDSASAETERMVMLSSFFIWNSPMFDSQSKMEKKSAFIQSK